MTSKTRRVLMLSFALILGLVMVAIVMWGSSVLAADDELVRTPLMGDFSSYSWPWTTSETWPGKITHEMRNVDDDPYDELCVTIQQVGSDPWDIQMRHRRLHIQEHTEQDPHIYKPSFTAFTLPDDKGNPVEVKFDVKVTQGHVPFWPNQMEASCTSGEEPQLYESCGGVDFEFNGKLIDDGLNDTTQEKIIEDWGAEFAFHFGYPENVGKTICFDDIDLDHYGNDVDDTDPDNDTRENIYYVDQGIRVNQLGYFVGGPMLANVRLDGPTTWSQPWILYRVNPDALGGAEKVFSGVTNHRVPDWWVIDPASGEYVHIIDFSDFEPNPEWPADTQYFLHMPDWDQVVDPSPYFEIRNDLYSQMKYDALSYFYHNRSGTEIEAQYVGDVWARGAGHDQEKNPEDELALRFDGNVRCFSGGTGLEEGTDWQKRAVEDGTTWKNCVMTIDTDGAPTNNPPMFTDDYRANGLKGWYDAGDHGKYVVNGGISVWTLLNMYERNPQAFGDGSMQIPEQGNGIPDILDEVRWELEFMLNMQVPPEGPDYQVPENGVSASGLVHHMLHDIKWTDIPFRADEALNYPDRGTEDIGDERAVYPPSTAATLNLAAVGAQCYRVWKDLDAGFADDCLTHARVAWNAANTHPDLYAAPNRFLGGGPYDDDDVSDEFLWAAVELYLATGDDTYFDSEHIDQSLIGQVTTDLGEEGQASMTWKDTAALGTISLAVASVPVNEGNEGYDEAQALQSQARTNIVHAANVYLSKLSNSGYGTPYKGDTQEIDGKEVEVYAWGSNSFVLNNMLIMGLAYDFDQGYSYLRGMAVSMDYLLGRNTLGQSYVSGYGENALENPHHRHWAKQTWWRPTDQRYPAPPPGAISGGPNSVEDALKANKASNAMQLYDMCWDTPQKCYVDDIDAFSVNEITINWNAPFAWVTAYLDENHPVLDPEPKIVDVDVDYGVRDNPGWPDGFTVDITLTNNSDQPVDDWTLIFTFPGNQQIYEAWGVDYAQDGAAVTIQSSVDWTAVIEPGQSITFGFNAHYSGENGVPTDFEVTVDSSTDPDPDPDPNLTVQLTPNGDVCKNILVTNNGSEPVDWVATFEFDRPIANLWNAVWSQNGNVVTIEGVDWNNILQPSETTHSIGFCPINDTTPEPTSMPTSTPITTLIPTLVPTATPNSNPNLTVQLTPNGDVCKNILVTNNGSEPVDWVVTFKVKKQIANLWNAIWSQNGDMVTIEGVEWNNILQPGETTHSIGFCPR